MIRSAIRSARLGEIATLLIAVLMGSAAALYNGYPLVYSDTAIYLEGLNHGYRSFFYTIFVALAGLTHTLWTVVFIQALLMLYVLRLVLREGFAVRSRLEFLLIIATLCALASFPWYVGFAMPDIFTPRMVLGLFLLVFRFDHLSPFEKASVVPIYVVSALVHYSHPPIAIGMLLTGWIFRIVLRKRAPNAIPHLALPAGLIVVVVIAIVVSNYLTMGLATYSPAGYAFEMSRLEQNGPAVAFLREKCATRNYAVCQYLDRLPMPSGVFLWAPHSIFNKVGFIGERNEGIEIVAGTIKEHPLWVVKDAIADTIRQLRANQTGDGLRSYLDYKPMLLNIFLRFPTDVHRYLTSRQSADEFAHPQTLTRLHWSFLYVAGFYCLFLVILLVTDRQWLPLELMITVGLAILFNAFVSGAIAEPLDRYGSRVIWMVPLMAIASWRNPVRLIIRSRIG
jgi:hypothetical protein